MFNQSDVISYIDMCLAEGSSLQRGMNYRLKNSYSVILMSVRKGAPYADRIEENGKILIYEGHDMPTSKGGPDPKKTDQPFMYPGGNSLTQNGLFFEAAKKYRRGEGNELVKVYEKIKTGIWVYNGVFKLIDAWQEKSGNRKVFKFKLELNSQIDIDDKIKEKEIDHPRIIPTSVKLQIWKRDKGQCIKCGANTNLHFDHIIPYSKGGSSLVADNIQLLCAKHNIEKKDRIE